MYSIIFYVDSQGHSEALDYIATLREKADKTSRVTFNKINDYFTALATYGTICGKPILDHLDGDIWEIRPHRERFLFAKIEDGYIILSHFTKATRKTPVREIERAKRLYRRYLEEENE